MPIHPPILMPRAPPPLTPINLQLAPMATVVMLSPRLLELVGGRNNPPVATVAVTRAGVRNYSSDELDRMLQCIRTVLPTGNDMWELVAQLHGNYFPDCNQNAVSIKKRVLPTSQQTAYHW
jgi:hypothetical protein